MMLRLSLPLSPFFFCLHSLHAATVWSPAVTEESPEVRSAAITAGGFRIEIDAPPGSYPVEKSANLAGWEAEGEASGTLGAVSYTDAGARESPVGFYRVGGSFDQGLLHGLGFVSRVESSGMLPDGDTYGGLWTGHSFETGRVQSADPADALLRIDAMAASAFRIQPSNPHAVLGAYIETSRQPEVSALAMGEASWMVPAGDGGPPVTLLTLEGEGGALAGISEESEQQSSGFYQSTTAEFGLFLAAPAVVDANPADLQGDWGFVRVLVEADPAGALFSGAAYTGSISAAGTALAVEAGNEFEIEQSFSPATVTVSESFDPAVDVTLTVDLAAEGSVRIFEPEEENSLEGFVSPTAKWMAAASTSPGIEVLPEGQAEHYAAHLPEASTQLLLGVKRDATPALAGKTYRIVRCGWYVESGAFEIDRSGEGDRLVFSADGQSATRTSDFVFRAVTFSGELDSSTPGDELGTFPMSVSTAGDGSISLAATLEEDDETMDLHTFGFAQEGGDVLVLVDAASSTGGSASLGVIIAVREVE